MSAFFTYLFNNKHYREVQADYDEICTKYGEALNLWCRHNACLNDNSFSAKEFISSHISEIRSVASWIKDYEKLMGSHKEGLLYFCKEKGLNLTSHIDYEGYKTIASHIREITDYNKYITTYNQLLDSKKEAIERFWGGAKDSTDFEIIKDVVDNKSKVDRIAAILELAHEYESQYPLAWNLLFKGSKVSEIKLGELETIVNYDFDSKEYFLVFYYKNPELIKLISGPNLPSIDSFSKEDIESNEDISILLSASTQSIEEVSPHKGKVGLDNSDEHKRAILDSLYYGDKCRFKESVTIDRFYELRKKYDAKRIDFDKTVEKVKANRPIIRIFNQLKNGEEKVYIEDYLRSVTEKSELYKFIEDYKQQKPKREEAKRIQIEFERGFEAIYGHKNLDTCEFSEIQEILSNSHKIASRDKYKKISERHLKERQEKEQKIQESQEFTSRMSSWRRLIGDFKYTYLLKYYPTTCDFEASDEEWADRWTVWNFKNTPGKTEAYAHEEALDTVIPEIEERLVDTFGSSLLKKLTLVCIPASSAEKTKARYAEFSRRLCRITGMINAYEHMNVVAESTEKKRGGTGITTDKVSFDEDFFQNKYILLFDDVITKGESMLRFKKKMESLGAIVIGGMSIGKTRHHRD